MFCHRCYAELPSEPAGTCPKCGAAYVARTALRRPFPPIGNVIATLFLTSLVGLFVAGIVAVMQAAPFDGH